jgi:dihydroxy-acid dehydratase
MTARKKPEQLRSHRWFGLGPFSFAHRSRTLQLGKALDEFVGRPVIAVVNTWSEMNTCHAHLRDRAEVVKRGVWQAGGYPVELPAMSLGEIMVKPSTMLYRNLLSMETEELLRSHPIDGAVLMGGCDKTTPGLLMGAFSMDIPCIYVPAGFMLAGNYRGERLGSGVDAWKYGAEMMAGNMTYPEWLEMEQGSARTAGTCNVMGTASTMTSVADALGMTLPGASSVPAVDALGDRLAAEAGRRVVEMVWEDLTPSRMLSLGSFENAVRVNLALGGSTNAAIHVIAMAARAGFEVGLDAFDRLSREVPVLANVMPSGQYLMEDFYLAGGLRALLGELRDLLDLDARTANGKTLGENIEGASVVNAKVIRPRAEPVSKRALAVLRGNLAPDGCVIKPSAASGKFLKHTGPAIVFDSVDDLRARVHSDELEVTENHVLVLRNAGPLGGPGMPEWGMLPIPRKLLAQGVRDMVRISDARMSGTSYGTVVLHVAPEAFVGGPLALVKEGDLVSLDVEAGRVELKVDDAELARRRAVWQPPKPRFSRGYGAMFAQHISQANQGCDFDFLRGKGGAPEPEIHY